MRSRRRVAALLAAALLVCVMLIPAPPTAYEGEPALVVNPVDHVGTLIGTGTGGQTVGSRSPRATPQSRSSSRLLGGRSPGTSSFLTRRWYKRNY